MIALLTMCLIKINKSCKIADVYWARSSPGRLAASRGRLANAASQQMHREPSLPTCSILLLVHRRGSEGESWSRPLHLLAVARRVSGSGVRSDENNATAFHHKLLSCFCVRVSLPDETEKRFFELFRLRLRRQRERALRLL